MTPVTTMLRNKTSQNAKKFHSSVNFNYVPPMIEEDILRHKSLVKSRQTL